MTTSVKLIFKFRIDNDLIGSHFFQHGDHVTTKEDSQTPAVKNLCNHVLSQTTSIVLKQMVTNDYNIKDDIISTVKMETGKKS